jgi:hypothetical protein
LDKAADYMYNTWLPAKKIPTAAVFVEIYFDAIPHWAYMELWFKIADSSESVSFRSPMGSARRKDAGGGYTGS